MPACEQHVMKTGHAGGLPYHMNPLPLEKKRKKSIQEIQTEEIEVEVEEKEAEEKEEKEEEEEKEEKEMKKFPSVEVLSRFSQILFVDLDNWSLKRTLPSVPPDTFVWAFHGGKNNLKQADQFEMVWKEQLFLHPRCGVHKDATDFALCVWSGRLDERLPKTIPFILLSGDNGFREVVNQFKTSTRIVKIVNPHHSNCFTPKPASLDLLTRRRKGNRNIVCRLLDTTKKEKKLE